MHNEIEHRAFNELRAEGGNVLSGVVVPYNRASQIGERFSELWRPGSIGSIGPEVRCNVQHRRESPIAVHKENGGLTFTDTSTELRARIEVAPTANGSDCLELVRRKILTGLSAEFRCLKDQWSGRQRTITSVALTGLAVVDVPGLDGAEVALEKRYRAETRGAALVEILEGSLPSVDSPDRPARIAAAAEAGGIDPETMDGILRGEIVLPPRERLVGFSDALDIPLERLIEAAIEDGGSREQYEERSRARRRLLWVS